MLTDAFAEYARENDALAASDYCDDGALLGVEARHLPADDREDFISDEVARYPESARRLVALSAWARVSA